MRKSLAGVITVTAVMAAVVFIETPVFATISKSVCQGCGCKYEKECDYGGCSISCSCQSGSPNDCYVKKAGGSSGSASKLPSMTKYRVHEAAPAAKQ